MALVTFAAMVVIAESLPLMLGVVLTVAFTVSNYAAVSDLGKGGIEW